MSSVYDGFIFNDELDLLELRLRTLDSVVDHFVLCELPVNFQQKEKPLVFLENMKRFKQWLPKIRHVAPISYALGPHPIIEHFQRREIASGFCDAGHNDWLIVSDVDEIPDPEVVAALRDSNIDHPTTLRQHHYNYFVNCRAPIHWPGPVMLPRKSVDKIDCEKIRQHRHVFPSVQGGWHFSWLGSTEQIQNKLRSLDAAADIVLYRSQDYMTAPTPDDSDFLRECRDEGRDLFGRDLRFEFVSIDPGVNQPAPIIEWLEQHPHYARVS